MLSEPVPVPGAVAAPRHHPVVVLCETKDGQVGPEAARLGQKRRVDRPTHRHVALVDGHLLDVVHRPRAGDVEEGEGGQVHHPHALSHGEVLGVDDRRPPPGVPFVFAPLHSVLVDQGCVHLVPLGPLPASRLEEDRSQFHLARIGGDRAHPPVGLPLLAGVHDAVGLVEVLRAPGVDVVFVPGVAVEPGDVGGMGIDLGVSLGHPLGDHPPHSRALLDPDRRRRPKVLDLHRLTEEGHGVRGEGQEAVGGVADLGLREDLGHQLQGVLHLGKEVLLGEGKFGWGQERLTQGRYVVGTVEDRPVGIGPDLHRPGCLALVHVGVHVADDREADFRTRGLQHRDGSDVDHLVDGRRERDGGPGHAGHPGTPHPAGDHQVFGLDPAPVGNHRPDRPVVDFHAEHLGVGHHGEGVAGLCSLPHDGSRPERIDHGDPRAVEGAHNHVPVDEGHQRLHFGR